MKYWEYLNRILLIMVVMLFFGGYNSVKADINSNDLMMSWFRNY